ncbi:MAG: triose-phosphate isomerase [Ammonifex sp.]|nr:MAG: triose-phosphate isomerase [Ammonifex sp.]
MERTPIIAANWKMHKTIPEAVSFTREILNPLDFSGTDVVLCPPFPALWPVAQAASGTPLQVAAQDVYWADQGAFTGEVSPVMLRDAGCTYVVIGHSERRHLFGETDENVNRKVKAALRHGLTPIVCVGETLAERDAGETFKVVEKQLAAALLGLDGEEAAGLVVAYEPVWAIGTGRNAAPEDAQAVNHFVREFVRSRYRPEVAEQVRIQYGGSVTPENAELLLAQPDIDGALVGGASLKVESFRAIVYAAQRL